MMKSYMGNRDVQLIIFNQSSYLSLMASIDYENKITHPITFTPKFIPHQSVADKM